MGARIDVSTNECFKSDYREMHWKFLKERDAGSVAR